MPGARTNRSNVPVIDKRLGHGPRHQIGQRAPVAHHIPDEAARDGFRGWRTFPSAGMDLARRAGATLLPVFLLRRASGYGIKIYPPLPTEGDPVTAFARVLEQEVSAHPDQWCVLYPVHDAHPAGVEAT